jgi:hypothetical protein
MRGPIELLTASWNLVKEHWKLFFGIFLVPGVVAAVFDYLTATDLKSQAFMSEYPFGFFALSVVLVIALIFMNIAMYKAVASPVGTTIESAYRFAQKYFIQYILLSIMVGVVVLLGLVALVIPGIIFAVWFGFAYFILIFEGKKGVEAMKASKAYVKGRWWPVFGRLIGLGIFMILLSIATGVIGYALAALFLPADLATAIVSFFTSAIAMPIAIAYTYFLYLDLKNGRVAETVSTPSPSAPQANEATPIASL